MTKKPPRPAQTDLSLLRREINQLFERLAGSERPDPAAGGEWVPGVDVYECHGELNVVVEVPGLGPEFLRVGYKDGTLALSGDRREKRPHGALGFLCVERPQGRFARSIPLDLPVDISQARARLKGGLLTITIPRLKDRRGREVVIPITREPTS
jgi:HSP20 family protein